MQDDVDLYNNLKNTCVLYEPIPGLFIIETDDKFDNLVEERFGQRLTPAMPYLGLYAPSFIRINGKYNREEFLELQHEIHHILWHMMCLGDIHRKSFENSLPTTPIHSIEIFDHFRHETVAYIISGNLSLAQPEYLFYTQQNDPKIKGDIGDMKDYVLISMDLLTKLSLDKSYLIYPCLTSRTFQEMKKRIAEVVPIDQIDGKTLLAL